MSTAKKLQNKLFGGAAAQSNPTGTSSFYSLTSSISETSADSYYRRAAFSPRY
jgi:hypothetical protein